MLVPLRCLVVACAFARVAGYTARSHRAHLSLLAGDTAIEEKGPSDAKAKVTTCSKCGFKKLWSEGLRRKLVVRKLVNGKPVDDLRPDAPVEFQSILR